MEELIKKIELCYADEVTLVQKVTHAILCVKENSPCADIKRWADSWLSSRNRTAKAAEEAAQVASDMGYWDVDLADITRAGVYAAHAAGSLTKGAQYGHVVERCVALSVFFSTKAAIKTALDAAAKAAVDKHLKVLVEKAVKFI